MTDKELLEYAASAAGIEIWFDDYETPWFGGDKFVWNPLKDDGDALRLEVALKLTQKHRFLEILGEENYKANLAFASDYINARRIAIVRAAAEIGKEMK